ncbi:hypothetical protein GDO81_011426 [Engystomops pustulosus]|uniref:Coiled-coil-helix-coiled-coil-helix domain-containing protein 7 n=1 Tax=Engystomops pustulosus TaxID=76066 RepID=A0AAV7BE47_ENGPU|nr:hypothetical protein GDO81_011426 [Engystomops pustulosus]
MFGGWLITCDVEISVVMTLATLYINYFQSLLKESEASSKCMEVYNYQRDFCGFHFNRYKQCRKFWHTIMYKGRGDGV